jgi:DNA polymerase-4
MTLKLRYGDFKTITRSNTLNDPTNLTSVLWQEANDVFRAWHTKTPQALRLLGFGVSGLSDEHYGQQKLFSDPEAEKQKRLDETFDAIRTRYGKDVLKHGQ